MEHLTRLARHRAPERRAELLAAVIDLYRAAGPRAEDSLGAVFADIVLHLLPALPEAGQAEATMRLAGLPTLPMPLALALVDAGGPLAAELLRRSPIFTEDDLAALAARLPEAGLLAIATRHRLSERITDALVDRGAPDLYKAVAANRSARLSPATLARIVAACGAVGPAELRPPADILPFREAAKGRRRERAGVGHAAGAVVAWPKPVAARPAPAGSATPVAEAIAAVASSSRMLEVAMLLAAHAGLPPDLVSRLIARPDPSLLVVLCRAAGVSPATFSVIARIRGRRFGHPLPQTLAVEAAYAELSEAEARARLGSLKSGDRPQGNALGR